jgi:hypothetical protein
LETIHPFARKAAEAFWCAHEQGKGEEMYSRLFASQQQLQPEALEKHAQALGLEVLAFHGCLDSGKYTAKINASLKEGQSAGVTGTPAFFLGYTQVDGAEVKAVKFFLGRSPSPRSRNTSTSSWTRTLVENSDQRTYLREIDQPSITRG